MAFWGAPESQLDHATRAFRAALAIAHAVAEDNAARAKVCMPPVTVRIGIHTGAVIVGNIGAPGRMNYTVVGDTVNIAQRLESLARDFADRGAVVALASEATVQAIGDRRVGTPLGTQHLRGRKTPIKLYRLI